MTLRRVRWGFAVLCVVVLVLTMTSFDALGADCGDAPTSRGTNSFVCNAPAYVVMAAFALAVLGLLAMLFWGAFDLVANRRRSSRLPPAPHGD